MKKAEALKMFREQIKGNKEEIKEFLSSAKKVDDFYEKAEYRKAVSIIRNENEVLKRVIHIVKQIN